ncbi:hypothetical protein TrRE_jg11468, partial [Triparma retinervis]
MDSCSSSASSAGRLWMKAASIIKSRLEPQLLSKHNRHHEEKQEAKKEDEMKEEGRGRERKRTTKVESAMGGTAKGEKADAEKSRSKQVKTCKIDDFDVENCINVIKDIAIDLQQVRTGQSGKIDDAALLSMRPKSDQEFAAAVASKNFFPRQVANFLDLDRCLKMLHIYLSSPSPASLETFLPRILSVVLQCILLNREVIDVADEYTVSSKTPTGVHIVNSLLEMDSFKSANSFDSASSIFTASTRDLDSSLAISRTFRRSTFASVLRGSFKIIESVTSSPRIHAPLTDSGHASTVVKILLCYVNGGKTKYAVTTKEG